MEDEQAKTLAALQLAIQMEVDGKEYYQKISQMTDNEIGKELFYSLAIEEDSHRQRFEEIYQAIKKKKAWPEIDIPLGRGEKIATLFAKAMETADPNIKAPRAELGAIARAMDMENKSYDFYGSQSKKAIYDAERNFYEALAAEERGHYLVLVDYQEYLTDPAGWFVKRERPSLDGG